MSQNIVLKNNPKIEFQFLENGFTLNDGQTKQNSGVYPYSDLESVELIKPWFPTLAKWLRRITWIFNGVPYCPDADTCKKANLIIRFKKSNLGIWLTDSQMTGNAKKLNQLLEEKTGRLD